MRLLYYYIINPFQTIQLYRFQSIAPTSFLVLLLVSFIFTGVIDQFFVVRQLFWVFSIAFQIFFVAAYIDFTARILGYKSNSFYLFQWLCLALLPLLLFHPLSVLHSAGFLSSSITGVLGFLVIAFIAALFLSTIRKLVDTKSLVHDVLIVLLPVFFMVSFLFISIMYFGVLASTGFL